MNVKKEMDIIIPLHEILYKVLKEKYIVFQGNKIVIIVDNPPKWLKDELEKFIENMKKMDKYEHF